MEEETQNKIEPEGEVKPEARAANPTYTIRGQGLGNDQIGLNGINLTRLQEIAGSWDVSVETLVNEMLSEILQDAKTREEEQTISGWIQGVLNSNKMSSKKIDQALEESRRVTALARNTIETARTFIVEIHNRITTENGKTVKRIPQSVYDRLCLESGGEVGVNQT